jgi:hypothetical protein
LAPSSSSSAARPPLSLDGTVDHFRSARRDLRVDTSPVHASQQAHPPHTVSQPPTDERQQRQSWELTAQYEHRHHDQQQQQQHRHPSNSSSSNSRIHHDQAGWDSGRRHTLDSGYHDHALMDRIHSGSRASLPLGPYGRDDGRRHAGGGGGGGGHRSSSRGRAIKEVSSPIHHGDLAYQSEQAAIEAKMERIHARHRQGDGRYRGEPRPYDAPAAAAAGSAPTRRRGSSRGGSSSSSSRAGRSSRVLAKPRTSRHSGAVSGERSSRVR